MNLKNGDVERKTQEETGNGLPKCLIFPCYKSNDSLGYIFPVGKVVLGSLDSL